MSACKSEEQKESEHEPIEGTWQLVDATTIQNGMSSVTDFTKGKQMIKILNATHFSFLQHDLNHGKDSLAVFTAGGGRYTLKGEVYTEHLEYCNSREWEDHTFSFNVIVRNDTLIQRGVEKIEEAGVDREIIERYVRVK